MALILNIETATQICSVHLGRDGKSIASKETQIANSHAEYLTVFIDELLKEQKLKPSDLDAIAVSMGPGSYTGLRIGVSVAKGLCYAIDKPLISVSTLQAMANGVSSKESALAESLFCPMLDARRMEVYSAFYKNDNSIFRDVQADIIEEESYKEILENNKVSFFGNGAAKCKEILEKYTNAIFIEDFEMSARNMLQLSENKYNMKSFEDVAYFEPFYLKEFVAGKPKVKGLE